METKINISLLFTETMPDKSYSGLLTKFLYNIYEWRSELREKFDIATEEGELEFIFWWIKWGKANYPEVSIDYGISREFLNKHVSIDYSSKYDFELPPLSQYFYYSYKKNMNVDSYQFINLLFQNHYINIIDKKNSFSEYLVEVIFEWLENNKERLEPNILLDFITILKDKKFISENKFKEFNSKKNNEIKVDLIKKVENKSYSGLLTKFLYNIYEWRSELREKFDIATEEGELEFIFWWIKWGKANYPEVSIDYGISREFLNKHVYNNVFNANSYPPLFLLYSFNSDLNMLSKEKLTEWVYKFGYPEILEIEPTSLFNGILKSQLKTYDNVENRKIVTIIGKHKLEIGIGYDAKLIKKSLDLVGINSKFVDIDSEITQFNIFTMPAPDALVELTQIKKEQLLYSTNILSCPWELPKWPHSLEFLLEYFDFIWVHSDFVYNSIPSKYLNKTVKIQLPVEVHIPENIVNKNKNKFIVLTAFDLASTVTRKNPYASIDAFIKAFDDNKNTELILKISNGDIHENRLSLLKHYVKQHDNITIIDKHLKIEELHELYASIDCFISLHRSEGFGRNIAEMMLLKKPVIVTSFSGNMDFTFENNSYLIPFKELKLNSTDYIFSKDQYWADPDVDYASNVLLEIFNNGIEEEKVINAYNLMTEKYTLKNCGKVMYNILKEYYEN